MRLLAWAAVLAGGCTSLTDVDVGEGEIPPVGAVLVVPVDDGVEVRLLDGVTAAQVRDQHGDKLDAVDRIDADVQQLDFAAPNGAPLDDGVSAEAALDGNRLALGRHALSDATRARVLGMVQAGQPVDLPLTVEVHAPADVTPPRAVRLTVHAQPILVVQALKAL